MAKNKKILILTGFLAIVLAVGHWQDQKSEIAMPVEPADYISAPIIPETKTTAIPEEEAVVLPEKFLLPNFPFQSQAPYANWDELHDEACEEASLILTHSYINNLPVTPEKMDQEIIRMVSWQVDNWKGHHNLTVAQTFDLAKNYYNTKGQIFTNQNIDFLKKQVAAGNSVIVPTAGRLLGNPNFRQPGPVYHMVAVIGFEGNNIIVQDVGTRNGDHYKYNEKIFFNAWHDWTGSEESINQGSRNALILYK